MTPPTFHLRKTRIDERRVEIVVDERPIMAVDGQLLSAALLVAGIRRAAPLCLMGSCYQCVVVVDEQPEQRACRVRVRAGLRVST